MKTLTEKFLQICRDSSSREVMRLKTPVGWRFFRYKDLLDQSLKVAFWLKEKGFQKDCKAALILDNSPQWPVVYFGILLAGGAAVPLDSQSKTKDLEIFINDSQTDFIFIENKIMAAAPRFLSGKKTIVVCEKQKVTQQFISLEEILSGHLPADLSWLPAVEAQDTASVIYSSGTTSYPKGIELSHENFLSNFESLNLLKICSSKDCFISILPLFHAYAFMATLIFPLFLGARIIYPKTMKSSELASIIKESSVSIIVGVPELFNNIHKTITEKLKTLPWIVKLLLELLTVLGWQIRKKTGKNILRFIYYSAHQRFGESLRYLVSGGAKLDPKTAEGLEQLGFTVIEGYGLAETSPIVTLNLADNAKIGSVGKPLPGVEVKIIHPNSDGVGEIAIRGKNVMKGYYGKPEETSKVIRQGWFYSGDLGSIDDDGYLTIKGRLKEMLVLSSGKNVFPDEVESYYVRGSFVKELGVFLSEEDQLLRAVIFPDFENFKKSGQVNLKEKIKWDLENISREMPSYKRIMGFTLTKEELPKTRLGKIKRYELAEIYKKEITKFGVRDVTEAVKEKNKILHTPTGEKVGGFLKETLSIRHEIYALDHLEIDLGLDSLLRVEVVSGLEKLFRIRLPDEALGEILTVYDLIVRINHILFKEGSIEYLDYEGRESWHEVLNKIDEHEFEDIDLEPDFFNEFFGSFIKMVCWLVFKVSCRLKIIDKKNLPSKGPYIICCNHASFLDAFVLFSSLSDRELTQTYFMGLKEIFNLPYFRWAIRMARLIPIDPASEMIKSMKAASFVLKHEKILCVFPEGQRSIDGEVVPFKKGIGILIKELNIPVVPAAIYGTHIAWPRAVKRPKPYPIKIIFGKPLSAQEILKDKNPKANMDVYKLVSDRLRQEVVRLWDKLKEEKTAFVKEG